MNRKLYWELKLPVMFLNFLCMIGMAIFLSVTGNSFDGIFLILSIWIVILTAHLVISYYSRKVQMKKLPYGSWMKRMNPWLSYGSFHLLMLFALLICAGHRLNLN